MTRIGDGNLVGNYYTINDYDGHYSTRTGFRLPDSVVYELIDGGCDFIVIVTPNGRYTISIDDWQDYAEDNGVDQWQHCSKAFFSRG